MDRIRILLSRCAALLRRKKLDADLDAELLAHIELAIADNQRKGMPAEEARRRHSVALAASRRFAKAIASSAACHGSNRSPATSALLFASCARAPASRSQQFLP